MPAVVMLGESHDDSVDVSVSVVVGVRGGAAWAAHSTGTGLVCVVVVVVIIVVGVVVDVVGRGDWASQPDSKNFCVVVWFAAKCVLAHAHRCLLVIAAGFFFFLRLRWVHLIGRVVVGVSAVVVVVLFFARVALGAYVIVAVLVGVGKRVMCTLRFFFELAGDRIIFCSLHMHLAIAGRLPTWDASRFHVFLLAASLSISLYVR